MKQNQCKWEETQSEAGARGDEITQRRGPNYRGSKPVVSCRANQSPFATAALSPVGRWHFLAGLPTPAEATAVGQNSDNFRPTTGRWGCSDKVVGAWTEDGIGQLHVAHKGRRRLGCLVSARLTFQQSRGSTRQRYKQASHVAWHGEDLPSATSRSFQRTVRRPAPSAPK